MDSALDKETLRYYNQDIIARSCIDVFYNLSKEENAFSKLFSAKETFERMYPENYVLKNIVPYFLSGLHNGNLKEQSKEKRNKITKELAEASKNISVLANKKIKPNSRVFFHSINNYIFEIAKKAECREIKILEHPQHSINRMFFEKLKGKAKMHPDLSLKDAVKESDICFIGAEAVGKQGVIVKKGSCLIAEEAKKHHIPTYVCTSTHRHSKELNYNNEHFESLPNELITGIIFEHGIFDTKNSHEEARIFKF